MKKLFLIFLLGVAPNSAWACACGCGVFTVGTSSMFPTHEGGMIFTEYDFQSQNSNWRGSSPDSADNNGDKKLITSFFTVGAQYMFNRRWGIEGELPFTHRYFKKADDTTGEIEEFTHSAVGDIRLRGIYSGFADDMSTGLTFGLKLPTGDYTYPNYDPDVEIGSGSTDILLGGYHLGNIAGPWYYFTNAEADLPVLHYSGYTPGSEIDAAAGVYFDRWRIGPVKVSPIAHVVGTHRWSDSGTLAVSEATGFSRILVGPGIELDTHHIRVYADVGFRVYQYTTGDQLVASQFYKLNVAYSF